MGFFFATLSGLLAGLSYPALIGGKLFPDMGWLAFFAWIPLFQALKSAKPFRAFYLSFWATLLQYSLSMYWLYTALNTFGALSPTISVFALLLLMLILSVYFGLAFLLSQWVSSKLSIPVYWIRPFFWISLEYVRGHFPEGGFPWSQIAYSQGGFLHFIQVADLFGMYAVTFLLICFNEIGSLFVTQLRLGKKRRALQCVASAMLLLALVLFYGHERLKEARVPKDPALKVGVVQGNIRQDEKWDRRFVDYILDVYQKNSLALEAQGADLILWPETSYPFPLPSDDPQIDFRVKGLGKDLLFGGLTQPRYFKGPVSEWPHYNSAVLINPNGQRLGIYHKKHLVPFGEYVPWQNILFFVGKLTVEAGDFTPGAAYEPLNYRGHRLGILICYEDIFPDIARAMVKRGADALINISNDAWYGNSGAAYQHQVFSQFRAIETRRALIRGTNTGISSLIDPTGRILWQGGFFQRETFLTDLNFYQGLSFYVRWGDVLPMISLFFCGVLVVITLLRSPKLQRK